MASFPALIDLKDVKNSDFLYLKVLNKICPRDIFWGIHEFKYLTKYAPKTFFEEYMNFKLFYTKGDVKLFLFKFWKSYTPTAARISVKL